MKRIISALALVTAAAVGIAGCSGDDDDDNTGAAGKNSTAGTSSTAGEPGANGGEPGANGGMPGSTGGEPAAGGTDSGNVMCDPTQDGVCQNAMDCPFVVDGTARIEAGKCGQTCVTSGGDEVCVQDCLLEHVDMGSDCAHCYAATVVCTIMNCLGQCFSAPESTECKECQVEKGCRAAFDECSGLPE